MSPRSMIGLHLLLLIAAMVVVAGAAVVEEAPLVDQPTTDLGEALLDLAQDETLGLKDNEMVPTETDDQEFLQMEPKEIRAYLRRHGDPSWRSKHLVEGLTVHDLIELDNNLPTTDVCTREGLFKRKYVCDMVKEYKHLREYCTYHLDQTARVCADKFIPDYVFCLLEEWHEPRCPVDREEAKFWIKLADEPKGDLEGMATYLGIHTVTEGNQTGSTRFVYNVFQDERLTRAQLMKRIDTKKFQVHKEVVVHLSMAKDKAHMELTNGVTVADLLHMNDISQKYCSPQELRERQAKCSQTSALITIRTFCRMAIRSLADSCLHGFGEDEEIDQTFWFGVMDTMRYNRREMLVNFSRDFKSKLEMFLEKDPAEISPKQDD